MDDAFLNADEINPFSGPSFTLRHRATRAIWNVVWFLLASWTPPTLHCWRVFLLRLFGAKVAWSARIYGSVRIWYPANLSMGPLSTLGPGVECYSMGQIHLGSHVVVSQRAHLCAGSHKVDDPNFQIYALPIHLGADAWICAEAFVGPGVTVGEGAVLAARGVAFTDLESWKIYRGNPAQLLRDRAQFRRQPTSK